MDGIVLINKPKNITSYDVVRHAKKVFKTNKIGHTGTLDPFAEGLLILCVGKATKLAGKILDENKTYEGVIVFNNHYDTYDITGNILKTDNKTILLNDLEEITKSFLGSYLQMPPIYSAIKVDGKKLYEYARKNIEVEIKKRKVHIYDYKIIKQIDKNEFLFETTVSKGTYIRSLAVDTATKLNTYGALKTLKRTKIGNKSLNCAIDLDKLSVNDLVSVEKYYENNPKIIVNEYMERLVKNGIYLDERQIETNEMFLVYNINKQLIALYEPIDTNKYKPVIIF